MTIMTSALHSAKGGAVETGCRDLYDVIHYFHYIILPQCTAPPSHCTPCNEYPFAGESAHLAANRDMSARTVQDLSPSL